MNACIRALRAQETREAKTLFVRLLTASTRYDNGFVRPYLIRAIIDPWCGIARLVPPSLELIKSNRVAAECIARAAAAWPARLSRDELFGPDGVRVMAADDLLKALLENTPAAALELEHLLVLARDALVAHVVASRSADETDASLLHLCCTIARQCYINEYVYHCTTEEQERVDALRAEISKLIVDGHPVPGTWIAAFACYSALSSLPGCQRLAPAMTAPPLAGLFSQQVKEPEQEDGYRATLQKLTSVDDATSTLVRSQYEDHPYPRWVRTPSVEPTRFTVFLAAELGLEPDRFPRRDDKADVLVAGCGTGQQSIRTAQKFPAARILAVDLSTASLAYAKRKTRELRIGNIEYAQADLLKLESIGRTFDAIECVGVLHHLDDPLAGWRVLRSILRPGGVMRIGLYSELARRTIVAARELAASLGHTATTEGIRAFRVELQLSEAWRPFRSITAMEDFYDTSGCRDLLFHAREHRFTLPRIKQALAELELDFVKFNVADDVQQRYSARFPGELARTDLNGWTQFEFENPNTFLGMYNFYVRRPR